MLNNLNFNEMLFEVMVTNQHDRHCWLGRYDFSYSYVVYIEYKKG